MWYFDDFFEFLKSGAVIAALLFVISPFKASSAAEFTVYRLQQFQLHGYSYGSIGSVVAVEAVALSDGSMLRQCVLAKLAEVTPTVYKRVAETGAAALVIILPTNMTAMSVPARQLARELEHSMLSQEVALAVYFAQETPEIANIYKAVKSKSLAADSSVATGFLSSLASDGYQMVVNGLQSKIVEDLTITNIHGKLNGYGAEDKLPTIALVAHYDSFAAAPELAFGADSNGSGMAALLEVARLLSRLYRSQHSLPRANMLFLLSGGGYLNYQGSKRFLEEQLDNSDSSALGEGREQFVLCLDTLAATDSLYLHVSRPPKPDTPLFAFLQRLQAVGTSLGLSVSLVHRKINLQDDRQPWEHHKYSLRRLPAATLSSLPNPDGLERGSMQDTLASVNTSRVVLHTSVLVQALLGQLYDKPNSLDTTTLQHLPDTLSVSPAGVLAWMSLACSQPRSPQLLLPAKLHPLIRHLQAALERFTSEVKVSVFRPDRKDPEFGFHDMTRSSMTAYAIKPATFDLLLSVVIAVYMCLFYLVLQQLPVLQKLILSVNRFTATNGKLKAKLH